MPELRTYEEFVEYARGLSLLELESIRVSINRYKYSDRYSLLEELIQARSAESAPGSSRTLLETSKIPAGLGVLLIFYRILLGILLLSLPFFFIGSTAKSEFEILESLLLLFVYGLLYYGISHVKSWVVVPVLLLSYLGLVTSFLRVVYMPSLGGSDTIVSRVALLIFGAFYAFQAYLFSKPSTRAFFKDSGMTLII